MLKKQQRSRSGIFLAIAPQRYPIKRAFKKKPVMIRKCVTVSRLRREVGKKQSGHKNSDNNCFLAGLRLLITSRLPKSFLEIKNTSTLVEDVYLWWKSRKHFRVCFVKVKPHKYSDSTTLSYYSAIFLAKRFFTCYFLKRIIMYKVKKNPTIFPILKIKKLRLK